MLYKRLNAVISNVFILVLFRVVIHHPLVKVVFSVVRFLSIFQCINYSNA
jgi:hypothetical protein